MKPGTSIFGSAAHREHVRRLRTAFLRNLSPEVLGMYLDAFDFGDFSRAALTWHAISLRDDVIANVKPKREKAISRRDWQVLAVDDSATAQQHQATLEAFWNNITAYDALNRADRGGLSKLIRQMMQAQSYKHAVHHLVWQPTREGLTCAFEFVPLWFFENRTGDLRFLPTGMEYSGVEMQPDEWMVTTGDALMIAGSLGYVAKRNAVVDWLVFSEKFGIPGVLGRTSQGKDTPGGQAMQEAVEAFSSDFEAVLYGDDNSGKIELIEAKGGNTLPFPALIERIDRRLAALWRGADLSSFSSSAGEGTGASLQQSEIDLIEADDALLISETLNEIEKRVLAWHYGPRVKPLAYLRLNVPQREDLRLLLDAINTLVDRGAEIAVQDVLERFNIEPPKPGADLLRTRSASAPTLPADPADPTAAEASLEMNALSRERAEERFLAGASRLLARAAATDRAALVEDLRLVLNARDDQLATAAADFVTRLPQSIGNDAAQVAAWETLLASSLVNGLALAKPPSPAP